MRKTGKNITGRRIRQAGVLGALALLLLTAVGCGKQEEEVVEAGPETAEKGVWIENHDVSGMTYEQIVEVINQDIAERSNEKIFLNANGMNVAVAAGELGLHCTDPNIAYKALDFGKSGSMIQQYKDNSYIMANGAFVIDIPYEVTEDNVRAVIQDKTPALSEGSGGSQLVHNVDGSFTVIPGSNGMTVDLEPSVEKVMSYMNTEWTGGMGSATLAVKEGDISAEVNALSMVQDCLGAFATIYDTSVEERCQNIECGTAKISGLLLYPGQSASVCSMLEPFTIEEGYAPAHAYEQGLVIDSIGGGVCQISTTLYNAVLRAELQIDERCPHSMEVGYIAPSLDAAIAENSKDLIFTNNTDAPVLIEGTAGDGTVSFTIYGHETREPGRTLDFESVVLEREEHKITYELDDTEDIGAYDISDAHDGLIAEGYKCVYMNGELISRELLSKTKYQMSPQIYTIGIKGATSDEIQLLSDAIATDQFEEVFRALGIVTYKHPGAMTNEQKKKKGVTDEEAAGTDAVAAEPAVEVPAEVPAAEPAVEEVPAVQ